MRTDHHPPAPSPGDRRKFVFMNKNAYDIYIEYFKFESDRYPRLWDTIDDFVRKVECNGKYEVPIVGTGTVILCWQDQGLVKADSFEVMFDPAGEPYPYIFGGDRWTMALRHRALHARAEDG